MSFRSASLIPYNSTQCPKCKFLESNNRCKGFITKDPFGEMLGTFKGESDELCPKFVQEKPSVVSSKIEPQEENTTKVKCAKCSNSFDWNEAYNQQDTPNSSVNNPLGHGDFRPRVFCPHCGFIVAEWDIDRNEDRNRWKWYGQNEKLNAGKELPPSPITFWGKSIPREVRVPVSGEQIDLSKIVDVASNEIFINAAAAGDVATVKKQISAGADIGTKNYKGETAVMLAAIKGHTEVVKELIEAGVDINDQNVYGKHTPLILAAHIGKYDTVKLLVRSGADLSLRNEFGKSAVEAANDSGHTNIASFLEEAESLSSKNKPQNKTNNQSETIVSIPAHETKKNIQPIKTRRITNYNEVPWYRRAFINVLLIFFGFLTYFIFPGIFIVCILVFTGDIYMNKKDRYGGLMTWGTGAKIAVLILTLVNIILFFNFFF
ncbi:MAG: hypothetical protein A2X59_01925 [Nitrospirae bacterium GWC2_42_7]|nr:MAG: hypothetical protein A2X59_01925 [Nitrospirae bacterium GWC2_42_7]